MTQQTFVQVHRQAQVQKQSAGGILQRKCSKCREKEKILQRSAFGPVPETAPPIVHDVLLSPGQSLDKAAQTFPRQGLSHDFSQIPVHSRLQGRIQAKLPVNAPGDVYEQEADRVADQVMATPRQAGRSAPPQIQRLTESSGGQMEAPASVGLSLAGPGRPLEAVLRHDMEQSFGYDFSSVRVHTGAAAEQSARDVKAYAYTVGHDIVFGSGRFKPGSRQGRQLIAHELAHVVQQGRADSKLVQRKHICENDPALAPAMECRKATVPPAVAGLPVFFNIGSNKLSADDVDSLHNFIREWHARGGTDRVRVDGFASCDGKPDPNWRLSCNRALAVADELLHPSDPSLDGIGRSFVDIIAGGETDRFSASLEPNRRTVVTFQAPAPGPTPTPTPKPPAPTPIVRSTKVSAVSFLSCAPCNPYTDDGPRGVSPPTSEPASGFRQKHFLVAAFTTNDGIHVDPATITTAKGDVIGITGFCGRSSRAHTVSTRGPFGIITLPAGPHGEAVQVDSELSSRLGATVPATLPGSPCGFLGTASLIPAIGNRFRVRLFADGTVESEFISATSFPFHYLYESGALKLSGGSPVSPAVDFNTWATSTGVPLRPALAGFKALREACCTGGFYIPCPSHCIGGFSVPLSPIHLPGCISDATAKLLTPCPPSCAPAGSACGTLSRPANP